MVQASIGSTNVATIDGAAVSEAVAEAGAGRSFDGGGRRGGDPGEVEDAVEAGEGVAVEAVVELLGRLAVLEGDVRDGGARLDRGKLAQVLGAAGAEVSDGGWMMGGCGGLLCKEMIGKGGRRLVPAGNGAASPPCRAA